MNRAVLERPFEPQLVKTRKGPRGELRYIEALHYIKRLNEAFDGEWSWTILRHEILGTEVIVWGCLTASGQSRHAFGCTALTVNRTTGEIVSQGDDIKAACTDAMKKAASLFGVGLELYGSAAEQTKQMAAPLRAVPPTGYGPGDGSADRLTAKQLKALHAIAHAAGLTDADVKKVGLEKFAVAPEFLNRRDASSFISSLSEMRR